MRVNLTVIKNVKIHSKLLIALIITAFFFIRLFELQNVGETWDEEPKVRNGQMHIKALAHMDFSTETWKIHRMHPPLGKMILAIPTYIQKTVNTSFGTDSNYNPGKNYFLSRVISLIFGSITLFLTYLILKKIVDEKFALCGVFLLALFPHFVAHEFVATLESIQLTVTIYFIYRILNLEQFLNNDKIDKNLLIKEAFAIGIILGFALLIKLSSLILVIYPVLFLGLKTIVNQLVNYRNKARFTVFMTQISILNSVIIIVGFTLFYILWPWLWPNPVSRLLDSLNSVIRDPRTEIFLGGYNTLPWYYFIFYFVITTPITYLALFVVATVTSIKVQVWKISENKNLIIVFILFCFLLPFLTSLSGFKQNGVRYLYISFPAFIIFLTWGLYRINQYIKSKYIYPLIVLTILSIIFSNLLISPYYLDYYNNFVGGTKNVYEKKLAQIGWWGEGSLEAVRYANKNFPQNSKVCLDIIPRHVVAKFRKDIKVDADCLYDKDYLIINNMYRQQTRIGQIEPWHTLIYEVKVNGAVLVEIYKVGDPPTTLH